MPVLRATSSVPSDPIRISYYPYTYCTRARETRDIDHMDIAIDVGLRGPWGQGLRSPGSWWEPRIRGVAVENRHPLGVSTCGQAHLPQISCLRAWLRDLKGK
jgi:hypothetical protein